MAKAKKLFTIGYEQTPAKSVLDELERAGVKLLVDVRAVASSRRPGFSKNQLAAGLDERGISYLHLRGLGTPKDGREAARSGKFDVLHKIYAKHLKTAQARGRTRRVVGAGQEIRTGLHSLLRARPRALPPAMDRRDHRRPRRRQESKIWPRRRSDIDRGTWRPASIVPADGLYPNRHTAIGRS